MTGLCPVALVLCVAPLVDAPVALPPSRTAWWLTQDDVKPITDLVNTAGLGATPKFVDRVGEFRLQVEGRVLNVTARKGQA